jgi:glycosyltransferase involved in cell wall biosynthesis
MTSKPKISVLMAVHRIDNFFKVAVDSILNQTFGDFELIIIANAMDDKNLTILMALEKMDKRVVLLSTPLPGLANALNLGLASARAALIARMDADDISLPQRFSFQFEEFQRDPRLTVLGSKAELIDSNGNFLREFSFFGSDIEIRRVLPYRNPLLHPCLMMRKDAIISLGGYRYGHMSEDHELFIRLARNPEVVFRNIDIKLFEYRRHDAQITSTVFSKKHFAEISGFLVTEFLLTGNLKYLIGSVAIHPFVRRIRNYLSSRVYF